MAKVSYRVRPETAVLTKGFDPELSVGSARPPVYRSSTYVFSSPEAAERSFGIVLGRIRPSTEESPDLIYARLNHPNAEILEDQLVALERGATAAAVPRAFAGYPNDGSVRCGWWRGPYRWLQTPANNGQSVPRNRSGRAPPGCANRPLSPP